MRLLLRLRSVAAGHLLVAVAGARSVILAAAGCAHFGTLLVLPTDFLLHKLSEEVTKRRLLGLSRSVVRLMRRLLELRMGLLLWLDIAGGAALAGHCWGCHGVHADLHLRHVGDKSCLEGHLGRESLMTVKMLYVLRGSMRLLLPRVKWHLLLGGSIRSIIGFEWYLLMLIA